MAARSSVRKTSGRRRNGRAISDRKTAMPSAIGVEMRIARKEEYSVPQRNGSAPNCPATGSQVLVRQNDRPNSRIDREECVTRITAIPATTAGTARAQSPVPIRKPRSTLLDLRQGGHFQLDDAVRQRCVAEIGAEFLAVGQGPF